MCLDRVFCVYTGLAQAEQQLVRAHAKRIRSSVMSTYRRQFEHNGLPLSHFRFPRLQKEHAFIAIEWLDEVGRGQETVVWRCCIGKSGVISRHGRSPLETEMLRLSDAMSIVGKGLKQENIVDLFKFRLQTRIDPGIYPALPPPPQPQRAVTASRQLVLKAMTCTSIRIISRRKVFD